jgi:hypothetical protein
MDGRQEVIGPSYFLRVFVIFVSSRLRVFSCLRVHRHTKLSGALVFPVPVYTATFGWGHSGRRRSTTPFVTCEATIRSGAMPRSTHCSSAPSESKMFGPAFAAVLHPRHHEQPEEAVGLRRASH